MTSLRVWVLDDKWGNKQGAVTSMGFELGSVMTVHGLQSQSLLQTYMQKLEASPPELLPISLFPNGTPRGNRRDKTAAEALVRIVATQLNSEGMVLMEMQTTGSTWEIQELSPLVHDSRLHASLVRWCNLGIREGADWPWSNRVRRIASSVPLEGRSMCKCGHPAEEHGRHEENSEVEQTTQIEFACAQSVGFLSDVEVPSFDQSSRQTRSSSQPGS